MGVEAVETITYAFEDFPLFIYAFISNTENDM